METKKQNGKTDLGPETKKPETRTPGHAATLQSFARLVPKLWQLVFITPTEKRQITQIYNNALKNYIEQNQIENVPLSEDTKKS